MSEAVKCETPPIRVERVEQSRLSAIEDLAAIPFSSVFSDHMLIADYEGGDWRDASIKPFGPLTLSPSITGLHYGASVFEGLKAQRLKTGEVALFRPRENAQRLSRSAARLALPTVPEDLFLEGLRKLVSLDRDWTPPSGEGALYIRPILFSTDESIRVKPAERCRLVIFTLPFGAYYAEPVDALVTERFVRAFPGGVGDIKPAGNYAPSLFAESKARAAGFHTVLWLDGVERRFVEECGVMNVFFRLGDVIVTPSLEGTILPGIVRDSVITLLRDMGWKVRERRISIDEVVNAHAHGELRECFGTGTAATLSHIRRIRYRDHDITPPPADADSVGATVRQRLNEIVTGSLPDTHGWLDAL